MAGDQNILYSGDHTTSHSHRPCPFQFQGTPGSTRHLPSTQPPSRSSLQSRDSSGFCPHSRQHLQCLCLVVLPTARTLVWLAPDSSAGATTAAANTWLTLPLHHFFLLFELGFWRSRPPCKVKVTATQGPWRAAGALSPLRLGVDATEPHPQSRCFTSLRR
jgi:hypothetical protein